MATGTTPEVVFVGGCFIDLICYAPRQPKAGETLVGTDFKQGFGGKAANQSVVATRLGANTAMIGKLGADHYGKNYMQQFRLNGVNVENVSLCEGSSSGIAIITVESSGQNSIVVVLGANAQFRLNDLQKPAVQEMIASAKVAAFTLEFDQSVTLEAVKLARKHKVRTILNAAPGVPDLNPEILQYVDILCPNETEAELLVNRPVQSVKDAEAALAIFLSRGCSTVIITLGEKGVVFASQSQPEPRHVSVERVKAVDTTGAGDAFCGALAFYLARAPDMPLKVVIERSCAIATKSVQKHGTQPSFPYKLELEQSLFCGYGLSE